MTTPDAVAAACPDVDPGVVGEFLSRMDPEYFALFGPGEVAGHIRLSTTLDEEHPARVESASRGERRLDVVVVGLDYFGALSIVCGLLACFGLDIEQGHVYTFAGKPATGGRRPPGRPPAAERKRIVDVFRARLLPEVEGFDAQDAAALQAELVGLLRLLGDDRLDEARGQVNRRLAERLEQRRPRVPGILYPVDVRFDNTTDPRWTVVDVDARDTPAFLYAVTNALAARGVYVHKVWIESRGRDVRDRFHVSHRFGGRIQEGADQGALRLAIVLSKQFTHVLPWAPDPAMAMRHFEQLIQRLMESESGELPPLLHEGEGLLALARLLGSSDFLWEDFLRMQFESLVPLLADLKDGRLRDGTALEAELRAAMDGAGGHDEARAVLNRLKDREMFFIDMKHLLDPSVGLEVFSRALTDLAEAVLRAALSACRSPRPPRFAVFALGKLGGREMGYASDMELLFVQDGPGPGDALVDELVHFVEARPDGIFQVDLRLRPYGRNGPLVSPLDTFRDYYREGGGAEAFERQALVKLRLVAGDVSLGREVEQHRDAFTYGGAPWDVAQAVRLRERQARELVKPGDVNLKYCAGGLLDVEYAVQYLQILHGARHPELQTPTTLTALAALRELALLDPEEAATLEAGYAFLRRVIEALRMVKGESRDLVLPPPGSADLKFLARRLVYSGVDWADAASRFADDLAAHMTAVADLYDRRFGRASAGTPGGSPARTGPMGPK
jgi:[glutamine synthetase] adenylyltransferase / [glutamine synthetase]-adenylyl-L-tyrosine phosphorylase